MKKVIILVAAAAMLTMTACKNNGIPKLETMQDTLSWAMGESLAKGLIQSSQSNFNNDIVIAAVEATLKGKPQPIADSTYQTAVMFIQNQLMMERQTAIAQQSQNLKKAEQEAFADFHAKHPQAKQDKEMGFWYEVVKQGSGRNCKYGDLVRFDYRGYNMLTNTLADQTYGQREPIQHVVGKPMFPGLIQGLQLMNPGSIYRFYFPSEVYIPGGTQNIPASTPVIYEVELHAII